MRTSGRKSEASIRSYASRFSEREKKKEISSTLSEVLEPGSSEDILSVSNEINQLSEQELLMRTLLTPSSVCTWAEHFISSNEVCSDEVTPSSVYMSRTYLSGRQSKPSAPRCYRPPGELSTEAEGPGR